jgi:hypothetical protein
VKRYGLYGENSRSLLSLDGRVLFHTHKGELEFLFPETKVIEVPDSFTEAETMPIADHPGMAAVSFPLDRRDFR